MGVRMRLGDLLVRVKLITEEDVAKALARQAERGGRLGDNLVAIGAIAREALDAFKRSGGPRRQGRPTKEDQK